MLQKTHVFLMSGILTGITLVFAIVASFGILFPSPAHASNLWADIKINGSDGPVMIPRGNSASVSWSSFGADSCFVYSYATQWTGIFGFGQTRNITSDQSYSLYCYGKDGIVIDRVRANVDRQFSFYGSSPGNATSGYGGRVLGAGDVVTGPEDTVLWSLGAGLIASLASYYFFFARKDGWGFVRTIRMRRVKHAYRGGEDQYEKEFSRIAREIKKQEKKGMYENI